MLWKVLGWCLFVCGVAVAVIEGTRTGGRDDGGGVGENLVRSGQLGP